MALTQISKDGVKSNAINTAKIINGSIQSEDIADNQIIEQKILDGAVSLAKLPHGDTNNDGKFLRANNGADPSFETVSIPAGTTINNNADNRVITGSGTANTLEGEANVTINSDGDLLVGRTSTIDASEVLGLKGPDSEHCTLGITSDGTTNLGIIAFNDDDGTFRGRVQYSHNTDSMQFRTAGSEHLRIDSSGRVLIGTTASYANASIDELQVGNNNSSNQSGITIGSTDECAIAFADAGDARAGSITYSHAANTMIFKTAGQNERMRLRTTTGGLMVGGSGNSRIGEPIFHAKNGGASENVASFFFDSSDDRDALIIRHNGASGGTSRGMINFLNSSGNGVGHIHATGSGVTYNSVSDYRLKENVVAISDGITRLKTLKPSRFNFIADAETTVDGFIAHEITAVPEAVRGTKDETQSVFYRDDDEIPEGKNVGDVKETVPKYQEIDQAKLIPLLTAALQEEIGKREALETRIAALEAA